MPFRVPLILEPSFAVIHRLNRSAIDTSTPYVGASSGYDKIFREPVVFDKAVTPTVDERKDARLELPAIRVPCQVEPTAIESLQQLFPGNVPDTTITLVFSHIDLERLGLLDPVTGRPLLEVNDRVEKLESYRNPGKTSHLVQEPGVYVWHIMPGSFGFGPDGHDLQIAICADRERAT